MAPCISGRDGNTLVEALPEQIGKEMVITVPAPPIVERSEKQIGALKMFQGFLPGRGGIEQNGVAQGTTQTVEDGSAQQEGLDAFRLSLQHLLHEVVHHKPMASCKRLDESDGICLSLHRKRG